MTRSRHLLLLGAMSAGLLMATILPAQAAPPAPAQPHSERVVCGPPAAGTARCHAHVVTDAGGVKPLATTSYSNGYAPSDLQSAYTLGAVPTPTTRPTIAIVDAYANPNIVDDLTAYRAEFNLPVMGSTGGPTFRVVNQDGGTSPLPAGNTGWGQEIALDVDMASAICPHCNILLVEANSNSFNDLGAAVNRAGAMGASAISNSYGGSEFSTESSYEGPYNQKVPVTVSSGDNGYGVEFPASSRYVTAVGGTSLSKATNTRRWSETAWSGAGSGCSAYIPKPSWQSNTPRACANRTVADVSAVANPNTGVAVYDSYGSTGGANWMVFGGTSVAAPIIASVYALAGNGTSAVVGYPYSHVSAATLFDVTSGSNGRCSSKRSTSTTYLCTAGTGYDGPTGLGTPNGIGAF